MTKAYTKTTKKVTEMNVTKHLKIKGNLKH